MLNETELRYAVNTQQRTYALLQWLDSAIQQGFVSVERARQYASDSAIAAAWIEEHYANLPTECRPERCHVQDIQPYANMLSSYLAASFELEEEPGERYIPHDRRTSHLPFSSVENPHFRPKKLRRDAKHRAQKLKLQYLTQLALDYGHPLDDAGAQALSEDAELREAVAMATYGHHLVRRIHGHREGAALLVLWREFAWEQSGSPKKAFRLHAEDILDSERAIVTKICT